MEHDALAATPADLAGHWFFLAASLGLFEARPAAVGAQVLITPLTSRGQRSFVEFTTKRRVYRFAGRIPTARADQDTYRWILASGPRAGVKRGGWTLTRTEDGNVIAAHHAPSMLINGGFALLARVTLSPDRSLVALRSHYRQLGLTAGEAETLVWRDRPDADSIRDAAMRCQLALEDTTTRFPALRWMRPKLRATD